MACSYHHHYTPTAFARGTPLFLRRFGPPAMANRFGDYVIYSVYCGSCLLLLRNISSIATVCRLFMKLTHTVAHVHCLGCIRIVLTVTQWPSNFRNGHSQNFLLPHQTLVPRSLVTVPDGNPKSKISQLFYFVGANYFVGKTQHESRTMMPRGTTYWTREFFAGFSVNQLMSASWPQLCRRLQVCLAISRPSLFCEKLVHCVSLSRVSNPVFTKIPMWTCNGT